MGSIGDHEKGATPFLERIKQHNDAHNAAVARMAAATPRWRRVLAAIGFERPLHEWQARQWLGDYKVK